MRLKEANALLQARCWDGAYYLGGYAAECALKACIARQTRRYDFPDKKRATDSHTHNLDSLLQLSGLREALSSAIQVDEALAANWKSVREWSEASRYERRTEKEAADFLRALEDQSHGLLSWLKAHW